MSTKPLKLALFDCDGTLVDSQLAIVAAMTSSFLAAGLAAPEPRQVRRLISLSATDMIAQLAPGIDDWTLRRMAGLYRGALYGGQNQPYRIAEPLYQGMREVLSALHGYGLRLGIATGKSWQGLAAVLELHQLGHLFTTLQTADRGPGKPNPDMVYRAMAEAGVDAADTVVIGDSTYDIEMANAAGVCSIGVTWGNSPASDLEAAGARRVVHGCEELVMAVLELLEPRP